MGPSIRSLHSTLSSSPVGFDHASDLFCTNRSILPPSISALNSWPQSSERFDRTSERGTYSTDSIKWQCFVLRPISARYSASSSFILFTRICDGGSDASLLYVRFRCKFRLWGFESTNNDLPSHGTSMCSFIEAAPMNTTVRGLLDLSH